MTNKAFAKYQLVYVIFFGNQGQKGYACFSFMKEDNKMLVGTSYCSPRDKFDKKRARNDAVNHMLQERQYEIGANSVVCDLTSHSVGFVRHFLDMKSTNTKHRPLPSWARNATPSLTLKLDWMSPKQFVVMNSVRRFYMSAVADIVGTDDYITFRDFDTFCRSMQVMPGTIKKYMGEKSR